MATPMPYRLKYLPLPFNSKFFQKVFCACFFSLSGFTQELTIDLRNPKYIDGMTFTHDGGVIQDTDLRIQAKVMIYTHKQEYENLIHEVEASEDLLVQYKGRAYAGSKLYYNFSTKTGFIENGKTSADLWFVSGDKIELKPDGSYQVTNVSITTCENKDSSWDLSAKTIGVHKNEQLEAQNLQLRMFKVPTFWFPSFKMSLKKFPEPPFKYTLNWDKGQGPRAAIRYQLFSVKEFSLYGRLEYRWATGWAGAIETEYVPENKRTTFLTRSFYGKDRLETAPDKMHRYRLQGALKTHSENEKTHVTLLWDKYNDVRMPGIFKSDDFEISPAKTTLLYVHHKDDNFISIFKARPRVNTFESIKQDLPSVYFQLHPQVLGNTQLYHFFSAKAAYLNFAYSDDLVQNINDFHSGRIDLKQRLQRPIPIGPFTLTAFAGWQAIFYTNSQDSYHKNLGVIHYGVNVFARGLKDYEKYNHVVEPYLNLQSITNPTIKPDNHYIFSIADGIDKLNQFQMGIRNLLFSKKRIGKEASFTMDIFANAFFKDLTIPQFVPRIYLNVYWRLPSIHISSESCWSFWHQVVDFSNNRLKWTIGKNAAISFEARYRSQYDWRKADHENFILDVTRSEKQLLLSPLSDRRITLISTLFTRINPLWEMDLSLIGGYYRINEAPYTEVKMNLSTWISTALKARVSYSHVRNDDRVSFHIDVIKKPQW